MITSNTVTVGATARTTTELTSTSIKGTLAITTPQESFLVMEHGIVNGKRYITCGLTEPSSGTGGPTDLGQWEADVDPDGGGS
ncbi:MAG: hypothetical protein MI919_18350 [Holophagales bacterium]|nr:hypothetical protein [Holophagales bacterium]